LRHTIHKWGESALAALCVGAILFAALYTRQEDLRRMAARSAAASEDETLSSLPTAAPWQPPVSGEPLTPYQGMRRTPGGLWQLLPALRYAVYPGQSVCAMAAGTVTEAAGERVTVQHGEGLLAVYSPLGTLRVQAGQQVAAGQPLGTAGSGGAIEITVTQDGAHIDPHSLFSP